MRSTGMCSKAVAALTTAAAIITTSGGASAQAESSAEQAYRTDFMVAGFFLRAGYVCEADGKRLIVATSNFLDSEQIKTVSKAFPSATEKWMTEGANGFNSTVMEDGIKPACASAVAQLKQIENANERLRPSAPARRPAGKLADQPTKPAQARSRSQNWQSLESDNGAVFKYDLNSIENYNNGTARMLVYSVEGRDYIPQNLRNLWFDCNGHYKDETGSIGPTLYAAPRSVAGKLSTIACHEVSFGLQY